MRGVARLDDMLINLRPLVLVGPTGAGKSSVGALLARRLGRTFVDVDAVVEADRGMPVSEIFLREGEPAFRAIERAALLRALHVPGAVVATGAGVVLDAGNRAALSAADVVHLQASVDAQLQRLAGDASRPLLAGGDREAVLQAMARARGPLYADVARWHIPTDGHDAPGVVDAVVRLLEASP